YTTLFRSSLWAEVRFAAVPRENLIGRTLAGYTLESEVGEGGTSAVFRAKHPDHGLVAVKVLREKLRNDRTAVARFLREARYGERKSTRLNSSHVAISYAVFCLKKKTKTKRKKST